MNEKVLRSSTGWKIGIIVCASIFIIPMTYGEYHFISEVVKKSNEAVNTLLLMQLIFIPFYLLGIVGLLQVFRSYLKIRDNEIEYFSGLIKHVTISANQIKSWTVFYSYSLNYHIEYIQDFEKEKKLKIEMIYKDNNLLRKWLVEHNSKPLSTSVNSTIIEEIQNSNTDLSDNEIKRNLLKYTKIAKYYNYAGITFAVLPLAIFLITDRRMIFLKAGYISNAIWFLTGLLLIKVSKEILRFDDVQGQKFPSIMKGMIMGPLLSLLTSAVCFEWMIDVKKYFFISTIILFVVIFIIKLFNLNQFSFSKRKTKIQKISIGCAYLIIAAVVFGNVPGINVFFATSHDFDSHTVTIVDKKGNEDIIVSPWLGTEKSKSITVSKNIFARINTGDLLEIHIKTGALGIKYFLYRVPVKD